MVDVVAVLARITSEDGYDRAGMKIDVLFLLQVRLVVELLWPLFLFFILVLVRTTNKPIYKGQCKYKQGLFLQRRFPGLIYLI